MMNTAYDIMDRAGLEHWLRETAGDNSQRRERLRRNLRRAMKRELTPRQQEIMALYFFENRSMSEIAALLAVNKSTVSRCLRRGQERLRHFLEYSL